MLGDELVHAVKQRAAAGKADAVFGNVGSKLGGSALEQTLYAFQYHLERLFQRFYHFIGADDQRLGQAGYKVSALYVNKELLLAGVCGTYADPISCVAIGTGKVLENIDAFSTGAIYDYKRGEYFDFPTQQ